MPVHNLAVLGLVTPSFNSYCHVSFLKTNTSEHQKSALKSNTFLLFQTRWSESQQRVNGVMPTLSFNQHIANMLENLPQQADKAANVHNVIHLTTYSADLQQQLGNNSKINNSFSFITAFIL